MIHQVISAEKIKRSPKKVLQGEVVSTKMAKTIVVLVSRRQTHPLYKKLITRSKRFMAHDKNSLATVGDTVQIIECRPLSKHKSWELASILSRRQ